jgi:ribosomal protein S18 acetylase RimI-like enzyme
MNNSYDIRKIIKSEKALFMSVMTKAFVHDPLFQLLFGDPANDNKAKDRALAFTGFMFDKSYLLAEEVWGVFENESLLGAYVVEKPYQAKHRKIVGGFLLLGRVIQLAFRIPLKAVGLLNTYMRLTRTGMPAKPYHYLIMIGVDPIAQGKGIGKALMHHLFDAVDADPSSQGVALDTENSKNVGLYEKFGFILLRETKIRNVSVYCMERMI